LLIKAQGKLHNPVTPLANSEPVCEFGTNAL
jgi:hypothetical protein